MSSPKKKDNQMSINVGNLESPYLSDETVIVTEEDLSKILANERVFFKNFIEKYWLCRYHSMKRTAETVQVPSITAPITDMPSGKGIVESKVENFALKSITAKEWLDQLHKGISLLPELYQKIIKLRYLERRFDGKLYEDSYVYDYLLITRTEYYEMKPKALEELGRIMFSLKT